MFIKQLIKFAFIVSIFCTISALQQMESASSNVVYNYDFNQYPVVYRRFLRRRPPLYLQDKFMEEIVEIFDTKQQPPPFGALMTDDDVDKFIFCDFNNHIKMCQQYWQKGTPTMPTEDTTTKSISVTSTSESITDPLGTPQLDEIEYVYSDENQDDRSQEEVIRNADYYYE